MSDDVRILLFDDSFERSSCDSDGLVFENVTEWDILCPQTDSDFFDHSDPNESQEPDDELIYILGVKNELQIYVIHPNNKFRVGDFVEFHFNEFQDTFMLQKVKTTFEFAKENLYQIGDTHSVRSTSSNDDQLPPNTYVLQRYTPLEDNIYMELTLNTITRHYPKILVDALSIQVLDSLSKPWQHYVNEFLNYATEHSNVELCLFLLGKIPHYYKIDTIDPFWDCNGNPNQKTAFFWATINGLTQVIETILKMESFDVNKNIADSLRPRGTAVNVLKCINNDCDSDLLTTLFSKINKFNTMTTETEKQNYTNLLLLFLKWSQKLNNQSEIFCRETYITELVTHPVFCKYLTLQFIVDLPFHHSCTALIFIRKYSH